MIDGQFWEMIAENWSVKKEKSEILDSIEIPDIDITDHEAADDMDELWDELGLEF